ncbi:MAG: hypothetical protein WD749_09525 [Phycisphaerales bacterium]
MPTRTTGFIGRVRGSAAAVLRSLAGLPAGAQRTRRGTVLVIILGALALIAVLTVVYVTVGQSDRRRSEGVVRREAADSGAERFGAHVAQVIGEAALKTMVDGELLIRAMTDYPSTGAAFRSVHNPGANQATLQLRFDPTGTYREVWAGGGTDPRTTSTPYLASTLPTGWDWDHISVLSPDGRFVNLYNLAPVINGVRQSGFGARSSFRVNSNGQVIDNLTPVITNGQVVSYINFGLTLLDQNGNPTWPARLIDGSTADSNIPAHWSMFQRQWFRPARGPMFYPNPMSVNGFSGNSPGSWLYAPYQWCDTDGDGFFDARWFELVRATDPDNVVSLMPGGDRFRWFAAVRVVDLNALVNVNTATDQRLAPRPQSGGATEVIPLGMFPSDSDLRRVFTMDDLYTMAPPAGVTQLGYEALKQPPNGHPDRPAQNYAGYDIGVAQSVGSAAYDALRFVLERNSVRVPDPLEAFGPVPPKTADERAAYYQSAAAMHFGVYTQPGTIQLHGQFGLGDLLELKTYNTANNPSSTSRLEQTTGGRDSSQPDFGPLRDNRDLAWELWTCTPLQPGLDGHGSADAQGRDRVLFDIRQLVTPFNGVRELRSTVIPPGSYGVLDLGAEARINARDALEAASRTVPAQRDPSLVFKGYAQALLPHASATDAWVPNDGKATLAYGGHPELAIRYAARLAANMIDSYDRDQEPGAYTLLIDRTYRNSLPGQATLFPWWNQTGAAVPAGGTGIPGKFDLGDENLADGGQVVSRALNVYGVEAQPIISEVASILLYTDAPTSAGGDDEFAGPGLPPEPITIDGTFAAAAGINPDFLGQILVVQLTNTFDVDVPLSKASVPNGDPLGATEEISDYYLEYGGRFFKLAEVAADMDSPGPNDQRSVVLRRGETRTFYILGIGHDAMLQRFQSIDSTLSPDTVKQLLRNQLAVSAGLSSARPIEPVRIFPVDPATGAVSTPASSARPTDLFTPINGSPGQTVHLWRTLRHPTQDAGTLNSRGNDLLVDRIRDPGTASGPTLDRRLPGANRRVNSTEAGEEPPGAPSLDNTGFTIAMWGSLKRRDDPGAAAGVPRGAIPAYCVEAKWGSTALRNSTAAAPANPNNLDRRDFVGGQVWSEDEFRPLVDRLAPAVPAGTGVIIPTLTRPAHLKTADPLGANLDGRLYTALYPEVYIDDNEFSRMKGGQRVPVLRVTDLLLPLAIGPEHDPAVTASPFDTDEHPGRITLTEALALALNYSTPTNNAADPYRLYHRAGDPGITDPTLGTLDRGNLVLNRFAPFEDADGDGRFTPSSADRRAFPGIPLAAHIVDVFTALPSGLAGPERATPGLFNINTMPRQVAMTLPGLAPTTEVNPATGAAYWDEWKAAALGGLTSTLPEMTFDTGAAVIAYRDRVLLQDRNAARDVNFEDSNSNVQFSPTQWDGRRLTTGIPGLREERGFASRGELLAVTAADPASVRLDVKDQIDGLAKDASNSGAAATNTSSYFSLPAMGRVPDTISDNFAEKLIAASGVMNSVSVRSDVFAAWIVVHGYQPSDTENLHPRFNGDQAADTLTPSVAKRYLMVIDRSNVQRLGQKPRMLLFTELPMTP